MITIKSEKLHRVVFLPESIGEITKDYFDGLLNGINLQKHYCVVAICYRDKMFNIVSAFNSKKSPMTGVVPIIAKIAEDNSCGYKQMQRAELDRTSIERGQHLAIKQNSCSVTNIGVMLTEDEDLRLKLIKNTYNYHPGTDFDIDTTILKNHNKIESPSVYMIEFKIVPINDIVATRDTKYYPKCSFEGTYKDDAKDGVKL